jgi:PAS domain S-box-containing protein
MPSNMMKQVLFLMVLLPFIMPGKALSVSGGGPGGDPGKILVLCSYNYNQKSQQLIVKGLEKARTAEGIDSGLFFYEYLDASPAKNDAQVPMLRDYLENKYSGVNFRLIITIFDSALDYLLGQGGSLSPTSPCLSLYAQERPGLERAGKKVIQSPLFFDPGGTLKLALALFPRTKNVIYVTGSDPRFAAFDKKARSDFKPWEKTITFDYTSRRPISEVLAQVSRLKTGSVVIYAFSSSDAAGVKYNPRDVASMLVRSSSVPVFSLATSHLDTGVVGGSMVDVEELSTMLAKAVSNFLGNNRMEIEPASHFVKPMVNWDQVLRWNIDPARIPGGAVIIGRPVTMWNQHKSTVLSFAVVTGILAVFVLILMVQILKRRSAEEESRENQGRYRIINEQAPESIFVYNADLKRIVYANPAAERMLGYSRKEILGFGLEKFYAGNQPDGLSLEESVTENIERILSGENVEIERTVLTADKRELICEVRASRLPSAKTRLVRASFIDITERKKGEAELRIFKDLVAKSTDAIGMSTPEGVHYYQNEAFDQLFGDIGNDPPDTLYVDKNLGREIFLTIMSGGSWNGELKMYSKDRQVLDIFLRAYSIVDRYGQVVNLVGLHNDITDRKKAEREVQSWIRKYELIVASSGQVAYEYIVPTGEITWGSSMVNVLGYDGEEIGGGFDQWRSLLHPDDVEDALASLDEAKESCAFWDKKYRMRHKNGDYVWIRDRGFFIPDDDGRTYCQLGLLEDVTEAIVAEEALKYRNTLLSTQQEASNDGILVVDNQGRILSYNRRFLELWNIPRDILDLKDDNAALQWAKDKLVNPGEFLDKVRYLYDHPLLTSHDEITFIDGRTAERYTAPVCGDDGTHYGRVWYFHDITLRKKAEEEKIRLNEQLHQARNLEYVGRLAGGVAHDFNNMLGVILGHLEMIMDRIGPDQPLFDELSEIRKAGERSADLVRQLLAFARKQIASPKMLDVNETVGGMMKMLGRLIGEHIAFQWVPGKDVPCVKIDPSQLDQLMVNLCLNARDSITEVGKIVIETSLEILDDDDCLGVPDLPPGPYVRIVITDNGCGMDKITCERIFEPFFTTKEVGKGTGLGLATVYGIVKQNGGTINVYSELGKGTSFKIYLPAQVNEEEKDAAVKMEDGAVQGHETVLVVEDETAILTMITKMLELQGYTVLAAPNPGEAVLCAENHNGEIHLLMTDVIMPEMNGKDLAEILTKRHPGMKCLFMSGYTADVISSHGVLEPNVNFIQKPFTRSSLLSKLNGIFQSKSSP